MSSLYRQQLGADFDAMPSELKAFHGVLGRHEYFGEITVRPATHFVLRMIAVLMGLPRKEMTGRLHFVKEAFSFYESWCREMPGYVWTSVLQHSPSGMHEWLGFCRLSSSLSWRNSVLDMHINAVHIFGIIPVPRVCIPRVIAREHALPGRLMFTIDVGWSDRLRLVAYSGFIEVAAHAA